MNFRNTIVCSLAVALLAMVAAGSVKADTSIVGVSSSDQNDIVWTGSTLTVSEPDATAISKFGLGVDSATVTFSPLTAVGSATTAAGVATQDLSGGTFKITENTAGNPILLAGSFSGATLTGVVGSDAITFQANNDTVNYEANGGPGLFFPGSLDPTKPDDFTITGDALSADVAESGGVFQAFNASDSGDFDAQSPSAPPGVPEPGSVAGLGLGALLLGACLFAARRRTQPTA